MESNERQQHNHENEDVQTEPEVPGITNQADRLADTDEEFAAEVAADVTESPLDNDDTGAEVRDNGQTLGWIGLALGFLSLFMWPGILGPAAVVTGLIAWTRGSRTLGIWSVVLGIISFLVFMFLIPVYA